MLATARRWLEALQPLGGLWSHAAAASSVQAALEHVFGSRVAVTPAMILILTAATVLLTGCALIVCLTPKGRLASWGFWYMVASRDKRTRPSNYEEEDFQNSPRKKVVFIRHGESEWNRIFNKGSIFVRPFRFLTGLFSELRMLFAEDSVFLDSPLSRNGVKQAFDLLTFLASHPPGCLQVEMASHPVAKLDVTDIVSIVRGDVGSSVVVSSILRRAISTGIFSLSPRLIKTQPSDKILLMTSLQEISRNVDALALTPPRALPRAPHAEANLRNMGDVVSHFYGARLDTTSNFGNKTLGLTSLHRQDDFVRWVFEQKDECVIVCGHSLWFKEFFRSFLPKDSKHEAKEAKMENCGVVAFDIYQGMSRARINPDSIKVVYGGFETKKKKNKTA